MDVEFVGKRNCLVYDVASESDPSAWYTVILGWRHSCTCPDYARRSLEAMNKPNVDTFCKHLNKVWSRGGAAAMNDLDKAPEPQTGVVRVPAGTEVSVIGPAEFRVTA